MNTMILQEPTFLTDRQGNTLSAVVPIEQYNELLRIAELYEELEDLQLYYESKADPTPAEPVDIVFKRIEARRKIILC